MTPTFHADDTIASRPATPPAGGARASGNHSPYAAPPEVAVLAAVVELCDEILHAATRPAAVGALATGLRRHLDCRYVGVAVEKGDKFKLELFTHLDEFDAGASSIRELERLCEATREGERRTRSAQFDDEPVHLLPLPGVDGATKAVAIVRPAAGDPRFDEASISVLADYLGPTLDCKLSSLRPAWLAAWWNTLKGAARRRPNVARAVAAAAAATLLFPTPYRVRCDVEVQPVVRRHVAAPFDGVLDRSFVKPGDVVQAGQALGRLDAKDLNWELAAAAADRDRAGKSGDVNLAAGKAAAAQIDRLEAKRFAERVKLLENRLAKLDVVAPVAGVVVSGNLERVEGAPVKAGQSLFEVAPLDRMVVEVLIPEAEVDQAAVGQEVSIYLDALPGDSLTGSVERIFPRAEIREGNNVFVAEVLLDNAAGSLRPGMKGTASLAAARRPLAWNVVHRLDESFWRLVR